MYMAGFLFGHETGAHDCCIVRPFRELGVAELGMLFLRHCGLENVREHRHEPDPESLDADVVGRVLLDLAVLVGGVESHATEDVVTHGVGVVSGVDAVFVSAIAAGRDRFLATDGDGPVLLLLTGDEHHHEDDDACDDPEADENAETTGAVTAIASQKNSFTLDWQGNHLSVRD